MNDHSESAQIDLAQVFCNWAAQENFWVHSVVLNVTFPVGSSSEKSGMRIKWLHVVNTHNLSISLLIMDSFYGPIF